MIGNSLRTDIVPALQCGIHALYIPAKVEWKYNIIEIDVVPKGTFMTLSNLIDVLQVIAQQSQGHLASS
jgi:putative hydrolase of the HAD superfamily